MKPTDILFKYLSEVQREELRTDTAFQAAMAAKNQTIAALSETLSPEQAQLFHTYIEQANYLDALELQHLFSRCTLLFMLK